jgi:hypothetical protein
MVWRVYIDTSVLYFLAAPIAFLVLGDINLAVFKDKNYIKTAGFCLTCMLFPAVVYVRPNLMYFRGYDMVIYFALLIAAVLIVAFILQIFIKSKWGAIANLAGAFILSFMFLPMMRGGIGYIAGLVSVDFIVLFATVWLALSLLSGARKILMIFFICATLYGVWTIISAGDSLKQDTASAENETVKEVDSSLMALTMYTHESVYLFMHDAFPVKELADELDLDYSEVEALLKEYDFKLYDVYSLDDNTLATMSSLFDMDSSLAIDLSTHTDLSTMMAANDPLYRKWSRVVSGDNTVELLLWHNGYKIYNEANPAFYMAGGGADTVSLMMNKYSFMPQVLLALMQGYLDTMLLKYKGDLPAMITAEFAAKQNDASGVFAWGHSGPDHSTLNGFGREVEMKNWRPKYYKSIKDMQREVALTVKNNPNAIVIIMSDHGPVMLENAQRLYSNISDAEITPLHFRDTYGAFMAIRWPDKKRAAKYDREFYVVQDLFPIVLAYLYDSSFMLQYKVKNTAVRIRSHKFDKGKFYKNFYAKPEAIS